MPLVADIPDAINEVAYLTDLLALATKSLVELVTETPNEVLYIIPQGTESIDDRLRTAALVVSTLGNASMALNPPADSLWALNTEEERQEGSRRLISFAAEYAAKL